MSTMAGKGRIVIGAAGVAAVAAIGAGGIAAASTAPAPLQKAGNIVQTQDQQPPKGTRATVQVSPNPAYRGDEVTITGNCAGGTGLKRVASLPNVPALVDIKIVDPGPEKFVAKARVSDKIGNGVGPVMVDCGGEAGVTLLITHTR
ncbi:hypothetical protein GCM10022222_75920 [Amycolatopsis ultiminotia]|uniref:Neocarzinostatin family protein n=1 Tax=Amycolatopsis ultiminotia TaxID=543629 RepID=A0ABP6YAJ6_9PSEU